MAFPHRLNAKSWLIGPTHGASTSPLAPCSPEPRLGGVAGYVCTGSNVGREPDEEIYCVNKWRRKASVQIPTLLPGDRLGLGFLTAVDLDPPSILVSSGGGSAYWPGGPISVTLDPKGV